MVDPKHGVLASTRLKDFLVEREVNEVSMPACDPNRGRLNPWELYAILHMSFAETEFTTPGNWGL